MTKQMESEFESAVYPHLNDEDDPNFWTTVFGTLVRDFELLHFDESKKHEIFLQIGACSHWLRPHQTRLTADGGFAYPSGYLGGSGYSRNGLPEFDWFVLFHREKKENRWVLAEKFFGKRRIVCRAALPARILRHSQAVIHLMWTPGTPEHPDKKLVMYYGFRKVQGKWNCTVWGEMQSDSAA